MRFRRDRHLALALTAAALLCATHAEARKEKAAGSGDVFEELAGSWSGGGTVQTDNGGVERLRCRADYTPDGTHLSMVLRCASDSVKLDVHTGIDRNGNQIVGIWKETSFGVNGDLSGSIAGDNIRATIDGAGTSGQLTMSVHGAAQSITLSAQSVGTASVSLRRQ